MGTALTWSEVPTELIGRCGLHRRAYSRGGEREFRFLYRDPSPRLPVWRGGRLMFVPWGNRRGRSRYLPRTGWTWLETIESGGWRGVEAESVDIPATYAFDGGVWYHVRQGMRGLLVPDERGAAVVYMVCEPSSHYYQVMTRSRRMPVFIDDRI